MDESRGERRSKKYVHRNDSLRVQHTTKEYVFRVYWKITLDTLKPNYKILEAKQMVQVDTEGVQIDIDACVQTRWIMQWCSK